MKFPTPPPPYKIRMKKIKLNNKNIGFCCKNRQHLKSKFLFRWMKQLTEGQTKLSPFKLHSKRSIRIEPDWKAISHRRRLNNKNQINGVEGAAMKCGEIQCNNFFLHDDSNCSSVQLQCRNLTQVIDRICSYGIQ